MTHICVYIHLLDTEQRDTGWMPMDAKQWTISDLKWPTFLTADRSFPLSAQKVLHSQKFDQICSKLGKIWQKILKIKPKIVEKYFKTLAIFFWKTVQNPRIVESRHTKKHRCRERAAEWQSVMPNPFTSNNMTTSRRTLEKISPFSHAWNGNLNCGHDFLAESCCWSLTCNLACSHLKLAMRTRKPGLRGDPCWSDIVVMEMLGAGDDWTLCDWKEHEACGRGYSKAIHADPKTCSKQLYVAHRFWIESSSPPSENQQL